MYRGIYIQMIQSLFFKRPWNRVFMPNNEIGKKNK